MEKASPARETRDAKSVGNETVALCYESEGRFLVPFLAEEIKRYVRGNEATTMQQRGVKGFPAFFLFFFLFSFSFFHARISCFRRNANLPRDESLLRSSKRERERRVQEASRNLWIPSKHLEFRRIHRTNEEREGDPFLLLLLLLPFSSLFTGMSLSRSGRQSMKSFRAVGRTCGLTNRQRFTGFSKFPSKVFGLAILTRFLSKRPLIFSDTIVSRNCAVRRETTIFFGRIETKTKTNDEKQDGRKGADNNIIEAIGASF